MTEDMTPRRAVPAARFVSNRRPGPMIAMPRWTAAMPVAWTMSLLVAGGSVSTSAFGDVYGRLPHGEGFRNVRDFGAKGDGVSDDTAAFVRALELGRGGQGTREKTPANVYVPSGTYLISDTLIVYRATMLAGDADTPPTPVLKKNASGFGDTEKPKPMIVTRSRSRATCRRNASLRRTASTRAAATARTKPGWRTCERESRIGNCYSRLTPTTAWERCGVMPGGFTSGFGNKI